MKKISSVMRAVIIAAIGLWTAAGCSWFEDPTPEWITVQVGGSGTVQVVTSQTFVAARSAEAGATRVEMFTSEAQTVALPWGADFGIRERPRFFIQVTGADGAPPVDFSFEVFVDGEPAWSTTRSIESQPLRYLYLFNQPPILNIEVI